MKQGPRAHVRQSPVIRAAVAIFAVLLNTIFTASLSLAASASDPLRGDYVLCPAAGGLMPAQPTGRVPANTGEEERHCPLCRLPTPVAVHIPPPDTSIRVRMVVPVRHVAPGTPMAAVDAETAFEARAPPR